MAGVARHAAVRVSQLRFIRRERAPRLAIEPDGLGPPRFFAVVSVTGRDGVQRLHHFPFLIGLDHGALEELAVAPFESPAVPGSAKRIEVRATGGCCGSGGNQRGAFLDRAVAIGAVEFDRGARLGVQLSIAVNVLLEVAVHALHSFLEVDVLQVNSLVEFVRVVGGNDFAISVEQIALSIALVNSAEDPAVAMEIGELTLLQLRIEFRVAQLLEEFRVRPQAAGRGPFRISLCHFISFVRGRIPLLRGIHGFAVRFVVPPGVAEIRRLHIRARVDVADHALAGGNRARERVPNRMAGFALCNRGIGGRALAEMAKRRIRTGMLGRAIVGVDYVARRATAAAIIARLIVRARKREHRVEQARLLQAKEHRIGAQQGAESAFPELVVGAAGFSLGVGIADFTFFCAAALEYAQHIPRLRNLPALERRQFGHHAFRPRFLR